MGKNQLLCMLKEITKLVWFSQIFTDKQVKIKGQEGLGKYRPMLSVCFQSSFKL